MNICEKDVNEHYKRTQESKLITEKEMSSQLLISELIVELEKAKEKYGDVPMYFYASDERLPFEVESVEIQYNKYFDYLIIK